MKPAQLRDIQAGDIVMVTRDDANGNGNSEGNIKWTAPTNGLVTIVAGLWEAGMEGCANLVRLRVPLLECEPPIIRGCPKIPKRSRVNSAIKSSGQEIPVARLRGL